MKEYNSLDELFRNGLKDYKEEKPSSLLWDKISTKLSYYKMLSNIKSTIGITLSIAFILITSYSIYNYNTKNTTKKEQTNNTTNQLSINGNKIVKEDLTTNNITQRNINANIPSLNNKIPEQAQVNIDSDNDVKDTDNDIKIADDNNPINNQVTKIFTQETETVKQDLTNNKKDDIVLNDQKQDILSSNTKLNISSEIKEVKKDILVSDNIVQPTKSNIDNNSSAVAVVPNVVKVSDKELKNNTIDTASTELQNTNRNIPKINPYPKNIFNYLSIEFSGTMYGINRKTTSSINNSDVFPLKNNNETRICTFNPGIELKLEKKNYFVQFGVNYASYGEKLFYNTFDKQFLIKDTLVYIPDASNPPHGSWVNLQIKDSLNLIQTNQYYSTYKFVEIPVLIGKTFNLRRFTIDISTGISFGFLISSDAEIVSEDYKSIISINDNKTKYVNHLMMDYLLRASCRYSLNDRWSVFVRPSLKVNVNNFYNEANYATKMKYNAYGFGFGLMYKF